MQPGVRKLHLRLDSGHAGNAQVGRRLDRVVQQRGLADPWLPAHHEHAALPSPHRLEQLGERRAFRETIQHHRALSGTTSANSALTCLYATGPDLTAPATHCPVKAVSSDYVTKPASRSAAATWSWKRLCTQCRSPSRST